MTVDDDVVVTHSCGSNQSGVPETETRIGGLETHRE